MNMNRDGSSSGNSSANAIEVRLEDAENYDYGTGTFDNPARWLTNNKGRTLSTTNNDFQYDQSLYIGLYNIYDDNNNGSFDSGKFFRIVIDGINAINGSFNLIPEAKNLTETISPPANQLFIDPQRGKFVLPRPAYWSKCENINNIAITPEIGSGNGSYSPQYMEIDAIGKFNNCFYGYTPDDTNVYWYPQGNNYSILGKGTLSFWMNELDEFETRNSFYIRMGAFYIEWDSDGINIYINGVRTNIVYQITNNIWHHIYIVWDKDKGLNGKSVKLYINNLLILDTSTNITSWDQYAKFQFYWWDDGDGKCKVKLDNVKLWNHIVSDDPTWIYNGGTGIEEAIHEIYDPLNNYKPASVKVGYYYY